VLATHQGSGLKQLSDLAALAKGKQGLSHASFGKGTSAHLAGEMLKSQLGIEITHVPYKGQAPALADLLGGQVSLMFGNWPEFRGHIQSGKLIALGMATSKRSTYAPTVPTLKELGVNIESNSWNGLLAPADTPTAVIATMNAEVSKALIAPAVLEAFHKGGIASLSGSTLQFSDFIQSEIKRYGDVIRKANITAEG
jgi:tripartite-type tricarboxylate transporter receptor subunit TctC